MVEGVPGWKWDASLTPVWLLTNVGNLAKLLNSLVFNFPILKTRTYLKSIVVILFKAVNTLVK